MSPGCVTIDGVYAVDPGFSNGVRSEVMTTADADATMCKLADDSASAGAILSTQKDTTVLHQARRRSCRGRARRWLCCASERMSRCAWTGRICLWTIVLIAVAGFLVYELRMKPAATGRHNSQPVYVESLRGNGGGTERPVVNTSVAPPVAPTECAASVVVIVASNFKNDNGVAKLWLHDSGDEWNADKDDWKNDNGAFFVDSRPIVDKEHVNWTVPIPLSVGNYGALVLHDKDENGKMKTNSVGMPKEGVGASRGAAGSWKGGPRWSKAKFWVPPCSLVTAHVELWCA